MDEVTLKVTDIIIDDNSCYRVIYLTQDTCILCAMECTKLDLICLPTEDILTRLHDGTLHIEHQNHPKVIDPEALSETAQKKFLSKRAFIRDIEKTYAPTFLGLVGHEKKPVFNDLLKKHNFPKNSAWRYLRLYLQSGMDECVLAPNTLNHTKRKAYDYSSKTGRKPDVFPSGIIIDAQTKVHFLEALDYYKSGRTNSIRNAFDKMNLEHYSTTQIDAEGKLTKTILAATERPTLRQFEYFVKQNLCKKERDRIKTSAQEQRNNKRLLLSDNLQNIMGPGDCVEIDEVEVDISLISQINPSQTVGRPIVYAMVDVYTRLIVSVSVAFDNNSVTGLTNCLMALAEDKVALCAKYGISIAPGVWPSGFIPRSVRADRGSEYRSEEAKRIFNELNINLELVSGGSGSLKGTVEQLFHQLHSVQNPLLEGKGLIEKRYDSNHHKEATLTIEDFKKVLYHFVVAHNKTYMQNYPLTHDMISQGIQPIPSVLWEYGQAIYGSLRPITNKDQFLYTLLLPVTAKLSRKGITYKGLFYMDFSDLGLRQRMYAQGSKNLSLDMRIDPRDVGQLFMLDANNQLKTIPLNTERTGNNYQGMTLAEYLELYKAKKRQDKLGELHNEELRVGLLAANEAAIATATANAPHYANASNIREARAVEKRIETAKNTVNKRISGALPLPTVSQPINEIKQNLSAPLTIDEAFDRFEEENY